MSALAHHLTYQAMFWLGRARAGSANAGSAAYWDRECRRIAAQLIAAGCAPERTAA
jgi:hypothetical protein